MPDRLGIASTSGDVRRVERGQQHLALRADHGREPGADLDPERDDLRHRDPGDVDDVAAVELADRGRLAGDRDQVAHVRPGHLPQAERADVRHAELEHPRGQAEHVAVGADVPELGQREQDPPGRRPGQVAGGGDLGQRQPRPVGAERPDHVQPAGQRLDELGALSSTGHPRSFPRARPELRPVRCTNSRPRKWRRVSAVSLDSHTARLHCDDTSVSVCRTTVRR